MKLHTIDSLCASCMLLSCILKSPVSCGWTIDAQLSIYGWTLPRSESESRQLGVGIVGEWLEFSHLFGFDNKGQQSTQGEPFLTHWHLIHRTLFIHGEHLLAWDQAAIFHPQSNSNCMYIIILLYMYICISFQLMYIVPSFFFFCTISCI